jgi:hypothetical protein
MPLTRPPCIHRRRRFTALLLKGSTEDAEPRKTGLQRRIYFGGGRFRHELLTSAVPPATRLLDVPNAQRVCRRNLTG